jgi:hypothetical protein
MPLLEEVTAQRLVESSLDESKQRELAKDFIQRLESQAQPRA